jgi:YD repeat-containing protein
LSTVIRSNPVPRQRLVLRALGLAFAVCTISSQARTDDLFDARGFVQNREYFGQAPLEHIDPAIGSVVLTFTDLVLPGNAGFDLKVQRTYNSKVYRNWESLGETLNEDSWAGVGWSLHFGRVLQPFAARPVIEMSDGSRHPTFANSSRVGCQTVADTCLLTKDFWVYEPPFLRLPSGVTYRMDHSANVGDVNGQALYTTEISDPFGNRITIAYMASGTDPSFPADGIATITQDLGEGDTRTLEFTTSTRVNTTPSGDVPLKDLSSMALKINGVEKARWSYLQTAVNGGFTRLDEVVPPEGNASTTWKYEYSTATPKYLLTKATTPTLGEYQFAYTEARLYSGSSVGVRTVVVYWRELWDFFNRGVTEYRYPGFGYPEGSLPEDTRVIVGPCSAATNTCQTAIGTYSTTTNRYWGLGTNNSGVPAWKVGSIRSRDVSSVPGGPVFEREDTDYWDPPLAAISNDAETVGFQTTIGIYLALPKRRTITRFGGATPKVYTTDYAYAATNLNDFGRPSTITEAGDLSRSTTRAYRYGFTPYIIDRLGSETVTVGTESFTRSFDYDLATGFKTLENVYGIPTTFAPTPTGNVASITDANNHEKRMTYDWGLVKEIFTPEYGTHTVLRVINPEGTVASETRYQNNTPFTTNFTYDKMFRILQTQPPVGDPVVTTYDNILNAPGSTPPQRIYTETTRGTSVLKEIHDGAGRVEHRINAIEDQVDLDYDASGRLRYQSDPFRGDISSAANQGASFTYDPLGRLLTKTNTADSSVVRYLRHDGTDVDITDELNHTTKQNWASFGDPREARLLSVTDADGKLTSYTYNALGALASATVSGVPARQWSYNSKNQLESETHPENGTVSYAYDDAGNLRERRDSKFGPSFPTRYCYDTNDRLVRVSLAGTSASASCTPSDEEFGYDQSDNRISARRGADSTQFEFDGANRLRRRVATISGRVVSMTYAYDGRDNLENLGYPLTSDQPESARHHARFAHDGANRVSDVSPGGWAGELPLGRRARPTDVHRLRRPQPSPDDRRRLRARPHLWL